MARGLLDDLSALNDLLNPQTYIRDSVRFFVQNGKLF